MWAALRFLLVVDALPAWMWLITLAVGAYASVLMSLDPRAVEDGLGMLLLWQMLCASRGFVIRARAGHFDPILIRVSRPAIGLAHALLAVAPVTIAWLVGGITQVVRGHDAALAFELGRLSAFVFVGAVAWALSLPAPRLIVGSLWVAVILALATTGFGLEQYGQMLGRPAGAAQAVHATGVALVCPFVMLGEPIPQRFLVSMALLAGAAVAVAGGVLFVTRRQYALEPIL